MEQFPSRSILRRSAARRMERDKKNQLSVHHSDPSFASLSVKEKPPFLFFSQALIRFGVDVAMIAEGDEMIHTYCISNCKCQLTVQYAGCMM